MSITAEELAKILAAQSAASQKQFLEAQKEMLKQVMAGNNPQPSGNAELYGIVHRQVSEFSYDPEANQIFKTKMSWRLELKSTRAAKSRIGQ